LGAEHCPFTPFRITNLGSIHLSIAIFISRLHIIILQKKFQLCSGRKLISEFPKTSFLTRIRKNRRSKATAAPIHFLDVLQKPVYTRFKLRIAGYSGIDIMSAWHLISRLISSLKYQVHACIEYMKGFSIFFILSNITKFQTDIFTYR